MGKLSSSVQRKTEITENNNGDFVLNKMLQPFPKNTSIASFKKLLMKVNQWTKVRYSFLCIAVVFFKSELEFHLTNLLNIGMYCSKLIYKPLVTALKVTFALKHYN